MGRVMLTCKLPSVGLPDTDNVMASSAAPAAATAKAGLANGDAVSEPATSASGALTHSLASSRVSLT